MYPVHDVDALLLLAMALASKRRPAELAEIIAAADLIQGSIPSESKLEEAFHRLSMHGLIREAEGGFTLTPDAQKIMTGQPRKADAQERILGIKENLSAYNPQEEHPPILVTAEQLIAAVLAHRASGKTTGKNMLVPKPKAAEANNKRPGQRKPFPARRFKA